MWQQPDDEQYGDEIFLAGELVKAGVYKQIGMDREIHLDRVDHLPASFDGRIACYVLMRPAVGQHKGTNAA